jgi:hypothetical protein
MNFSERVAKAVVESALPGSKMEFRRVQSKGEWDFDLWLPDGGQAALEVTASVDQGHREFLSVLANESKGGQFVWRSLCQKDWFVDPEEGARIDLIRANVDRYLRPIEELGLSQFFAATGAGEYDEVRRIWQDLRIASGQVIRWNPTGRIGIAAPTRGGWIEDDYIREAVQDEANRRDNQTKLAASRRSQRHLFVYVDPTNHRAWGPMVRGRMPTVEPTLPAAITHAWAVSSTGMRDRFRVMRFELKGGWYDCGVVLAIVALDRIS